MAAPKDRPVEKKNPLAATHDWVLVMDGSKSPRGSAKKTFQWVEKNWWTK